MTNSNLIRTRVALVLCSVLAAGCGEKGTESKPTEPAEPEPAGPDHAADFARLCKYATTAVGMGDRPTRRRAFMTVADRLETVGARNTLGAAGAAKKEHKLAMLQAGADELGVKGWDCPAIADIYGRQLPLGQSLTPDAAPPVTGPCETLDRAECLRALHCTMHWIESSTYECRPSEGPCEVDLMQTDTKTCAARDGCKWDPGGCYCRFPGYGKTQVEDKQKNAGGACACGGGKPPICKAADAK